MSCGGRKQEKYSVLSSLFAQFLRKQVTTPETLLLSGRSPIHLINSKALDSSPALTLRTSLRGGPLFWMEGREQIRTAMESTRVGTQVFQGGGAFGWMLAII
eukprot:1315256-Amorphochlora_amoeboformis.AAC.1